METEVIEETEIFEESPVDACEKIMVSNEDECLKYFVQRMKLAVAIAVIRSTPQDMTPAAYALYLSRNFIDDISESKDKCETLKRELIALEQKLQTVAMKEKFNIPNMDLIVCEEPPFLKSPPCMDIALNIKTKISDAVEFVRSFIFIGSLPHDMEQMNPGTNEKLQETILLSISLMFEHLRSFQGLSMEYQITKCAMKEIHRLYDARANCFEKGLTEICLKFVDNLLLDTYSTLEINMVEYQHRRSALIQMLAEHKKLTVVILCRLLKEIIVYSKHIQSNFDTVVEDFTSLLRIENAYFILQTTEGIIHILRQQKSLLSFYKIPKSLLIEWNKSAENALLDIGARFSMYSIYVWNVKSLLESVFDTNYTV